MQLMPETGLFVDFPRGAVQVSTMTLAHFPELKRLPRRTRLKIAEELWDSAAGDDLPVPATHKKLIRARRAAYERGEVKTLTMAELKKSIRRRNSA
jgi:putative addiction module component (TIGR02574 family)